MGTSSIDKVQKAIKKFQPELLAKAGVSGVAIGRRIRDGVQGGPGYVLTVFVTKKLPPHAVAAEDFVPSSVNGVDTDVVEVGEVRALDVYTGRYRPAPGGVSIGHVDITAGTLGARVFADDGTRLILSNSHVLANSGLGQLGDVILQPGRHDGGVRPADIIGNLLRFAPIEFEAAPPCPIASTIVGGLNALYRGLGRKTRFRSTVNQAENTVDAAVALPASDEHILDTINDIGLVAGRRMAVPGLRVQKTGRTSGHQVGEVTNVGATIEVSYGEHGVARFVDQVIFSHMGDPGDSGSLIVSESNEAVALLFAGSDQVTIGNPIEAVLEALRVSI